MKKKLPQDATMKPCHVQWLPVRSRLTAKGIAGIASVWMFLMAGCSHVESLSAPSQTRAVDRIPGTNPSYPTEYKLWEEPLSIQSFNMDLHNLAMEDPQKAQDALEIMEQFYPISNNNNNNITTTAAVRPNAASYATVMEGWSYGYVATTKEDRTFVATQVQALLDRMEQAEHLQPNELCYLMACQQWADAIEGDVTGQNVQRAQDILDRLLLQPTTPTTPLTGNTTTNDATTNTTTTTTTTPTRRRTIPISTKLYTIVMDAWCRRAGKIPHAMDQVEQLLQQMEEGKNDLLPRPNVLTYTSVIGGLARSRKRDMGTRAMKLLQNMKLHGVEPDMVAYSSILNCWAKTTSREERRHAHTHALAILQDMENQYIAQQRYHVKPTAITYATAIKAIGNSLVDNAPELAEQVLHRMYQLTESGRMHVPPTVEVYNALIMSLSVVGSSKSWSRSTRAHKAEQWLFELYHRHKQQQQQSPETGLEPNVRTWGAVLKAWAESGRPDAGEQAQRVLDQMEQWYQAGESSVAPNVICYTTVMTAWARGSGTNKSPPKVALQRVEKLLRHMEELYLQTKDPTVRPNKISYITAIDAWCRKAPKKAQAAIQAQSIVDRMMKLYALNLGYDRPTRIVFNALIHAYSKSDDPNAAIQAETIFRWMEEQYRGGDDCVQPDEMTLCGVLNAWANHATNGGARRAQEILDHTESLTSQERGFEHSVVSYNILLKAWGRSREPDAVQRAESILLRLEQQCHIHETKRPDVTTYSSVINGCAYYSSGDEVGRQDAWNVALRTFWKIQKQTYCLEGPNHITFGTMFKAIAKLKPLGSLEQDALVEKLLRECARLGQVDVFVLSQLKAASSMDLFQRLIFVPTSVQNSNKHDRENGDENHNYDKLLKALPRDWGCNVPAWEA